MRTITQSQTAQVLEFLMVSSTDHITPVTGISPTVTISKNGAAFGSPAGAVTEIANGWYKVAGNATDANTLGPLILHATGTGADPSDVVWDVVSYNMQDAVRLGLTALPNAAANANGGLPILSSSGTTLDYTLSTLTTYTGNTPQTGDAYARIGATGSGLTSLAPSATALSTAVWTAPPTGFLAATFPATVASTTNITAGTITTVTNLTNLPSIPAGWITAAGVADGAIDAATFASGALDAVWSTAARTLTAGTNIQLPANGLSNVVSWTVAITGNITGNLSGSVGSVAGNVSGNVVGNVNGSVAGSVGSVTGNVATVGGIVPPTAAQIDTQLSGVHGSGSWGAGGSGSGAYTITVTVTDGATALQNATVRVTEGINSYTVTTGALGTGEFALNAATYDVAVTKDGYSFTPTTRTVTGNEAGTLTNDLEMELVVIPQPTSPNLCTVAMTIINIEGDPVVGTVVTFSLYPAKSGKDDGNVVAILTATATSDSDGLVTTQLLRTDEITPAGAYYTMSSDTATVPSQQIYLESATKDLATIIV